MGAEFGANYYFFSESDPKTIYNCEAVGETEDEVLWKPKITLMLSLVANRRLEH